jgi:hypothetical protein
MLRMRVSTSGYTISLGHPHFREPLENASRRNDSTILPRLPIFMMQGLPTFWRLHLSQVIASAQRDPTADLRAATASGGPISRIALIPNGLASCFANVPIGPAISEFERVGIEFHWFF